MHTSVAIHNKKRPGSLVIPFLVSPLWARLTRLLRHPHTLRTVQSPKPAPRNWRVVAIPSTTLEADARTLRNAMTQLACPASHTSESRIPGEQRKC